MSSRRRSKQARSDSRIVETTLHSLYLGFSVALQPANVWYAFLGCLVGTLVGVLPGIGPLAGISILLPVTFGLNATQAIIMLAGIYYGSQYGGSTTSILMRIPGEASSVMTCIDAFGPRRAMFGSDYPVGRRNLSYQDTCERFKDIIQDFSPQEQRDLFHDNAARYYRFA